MSLSVKGLIVLTQDISNEISSIEQHLLLEEVEIKSETTGRIINISFKEGSFVSKGQLLIKINDSELQAQLSKVKSRLKITSGQGGKTKGILLKNNYPAQKNMKLH